MLVNAPLVDQLNEPTIDGGPDEAAAANCVPASLSSALMALWPGRRYDGDELRDAVYGEGSMGGTDPVRYIPYLAGQGVLTTEFDSGDGWALVHTIVAGLQRHEPVTGAIPSMWGIQDAAYVAAHPGTSTHEVLWCDFDGANLTAMNPWPVNGSTAFYQTMPLAWWASRIVYSRVFTLAKEQPVPYTKNPDGSITYPNGITLHTATAAYVVANNLGGTPMQAQQYVGTRYGFTPFDDGTVLVWDGQAQQIETNLAGVVIHLLCTQPAPPPAVDSKAEHALAQVAALLPILNNAQSIITH